MKHLMLLPLALAVFAGPLIKNEDKPACPKCKNHKKVIPVVYGKPGAALIKKVEKGQAKLGGCVIGEDAPRFYCNKDSLYF